MSGETMTAANFGVDEYYNASIPPELYASEAQPDDEPRPDDVPVEEPPAEPETEEVSVPAEPDAPPEEPPA